MLPESHRPSAVGARQRSLSRSTSASQQQHRGSFHSPPSAPGDRPPIGASSPAFSASSARKKPAATDQAASTAFITSPPIPEFGQTYANDVEGSLTQSLLRSPHGSVVGSPPRPEKDNTGKPIRSSLTSSFTPPAHALFYPGTSLGRIILFVSLATNVICGLIATNQYFFVSTSLQGTGTTSADCEKIDTQSQLQSCDLKGRANKQQCGVGMLTSPWTDLRHLTDKQITERKLAISTELSPDPTCPRSAGSFDIATKHRDSGTVRVMTFALLYYEEPLFLSHQIASWLNWSKLTRGKFNFLIVDDGSRPGLKATDVIAGIEHELFALKLDLEIYEIEDDLCWNIAGARNLAVHMAKTEYLYLGDADTIVKDDTAQYMLNLKYDDEVDYRSKQTRSLHYQFDRIRSDGVTRKPHPAVMVISKQTYWTAGGCDEDGFFTSGKFRQRAKRAGVKIGNVTDSMVERGVTPLRELDFEVSCPDGIMVNCNSMVKFKAENILPRPDKPDQTVYWRMKLDGIKPWSNDYLRFTWKKAYPTY